jgi:hypothetical protein
MGAKQLQHAAILVPPLPHLSDLNKIMNNTIRDILVKNVPVEQALAEAENSWTEILNRPQQQ